MTDKVTEIVDKMEQLGFYLGGEQRIKLWIEDLYYLDFDFPQKNFHVFIFGNEKMSKLYCYGVYANFKAKTGNIVRLISISKEINDLIDEINKTREIIGNAFPGLIDGSEDIREVYEQLKKNNVLEVE